MNHQKYLDNCQALFSYYKSLADRAIETLSVEDIYRVPAPGSNSIFIVIKHLSGNMRSRWRDFLTTDGEKSDRHRDTEFETSDMSLDAIKTLWENGWQYLFSALENAKTVDDDYIVYIRNEGHTIEQAVQRQLAHYSYHIGQIVYISKMIQEENFKSLSISKNDSKQYNDAKFKIDKEVKFFTQDVNKKLHKL